MFKQIAYTMDTAVLSTAQLTFSYPNGPTLLFKDLYIPQKTHTLILGDSGSGKSTLLNLLGGLSRPSNGSVTVLGQEMYSMSNATLDIFRAQNIGFIFQEAHLLRNLTVAENIKLAISLAKNKIDEKQITTILKQLRLESESNKYPQQLSRGQLQRAAIARAIINRPKILFADEPTAALDDDNTSRVYMLLQEVADKYGATLIVATHDKRLKDNFSNTYSLEKTDDI